MKARFFILLLTLVSSAAASPTPCRPFSIYQGFNVPVTWESRPVVEEKPTSENEILARLSLRPGYGKFTEAFRLWKKKHSDELSRQERIEWLRCVDFYSSQDTLRDGTPDWGALVDGEPSRILYPLKEDFDGDGTSNLFDPEPFNARVAGLKYPVDVPAHLKLRRASTASLQTELFREFHVLALDASDEQSSTVLKNVLFLLRRGFPKKAIPSFEGFRTLYSLASHDSVFDVAAYHLGLRAISVGGQMVYPENGSREREVPLLAALAHEMGHAFLLARLSPAELRDVSVTYGGWGNVFGVESPGTFYAPAFFARYPASVSPLEAKKWSFVSGYAQRGIHEWFAEAFAGVALERLGKEGLLGLDWRRALVRAPRKKHEFPVNYNEVSLEFSRWLAKKFRSSD